MITHSLIFTNVRHTRMTTSNSLVIGSESIEPDDQLDFGDSIGSISASALRSAAALREGMTSLSCQPQLAAYLFALTRKPRLMNHYFPITEALDRHAEADFHRLIARIAQNENFGLRLLGDERRDLTEHVPPDVGYLVAGHIAEIFFYRHDLLDEFLKKRRGFLLYTTTQAFRDDGGVAGGCYNPTRDAILLVLSRLYEGFYAPTPGVAPFIHEFGHMLDHASGGRGLIPGMNEHMELWRRGKRLELERCEALREGKQLDKLPIGHPYVLQNDGEFVAGYLEMFFRNPHYFAAQNPDLYEAFAQCLKQDPRRYWREDFPYYVKQNRDYYAKERPPKPGITIPEL